MNQRQQAAPKGTAVPAARGAAAHHNDEHQGLTGMVVDFAVACNQLVQNSCGMCTFYCDEQLQYESVLDKYNTVAINSFHHSNPFHDEDDHPDDQDDQDTAAT